ncbi:YjbH domain-containing protein [Chitinasiproducens palmae]|uniref:Capsule biosynthesis GfcC n=1 Tax=Chitinasiproducens palmae TaxID=1770053 RepID=A0A1H2PPC7_9BURK|nr:YjbH domain-containing protein [Chitinasiproducens palmae]SDV48592.1 Capsule biosynthesis GfcC [Chitinasiproducens palmae]
MDKTRERGVGAGYVLACLLICGVPMSAWGQVSATIDRRGYLGDWLVGSPAALRGVTPTADGGAQPLYRPGTMWTTPDERAAQTARRQTLLNYIRYLPLSKTLDAAARERLYQLVASRPVTGRVPLQGADPRWLKANDASDPMLSPGDTVSIPVRPGRVAVIRPDGKLCLVPHRPGAQALQYVRACDAEAAPDYAWVVQPDGQVSKYAVAAWNRTAQNVPAPGAWIWAPDRRGKWSEGFSERLAAFFATQGAADVPVDPLLLSAKDVNGEAPNTALKEQGGTAAGIAEVEASRIPDQRPARDLQVTSSDWGTMGVLQTPSARFGEAGNVSFTASYISPYTRLSVMLQPLDWFEFGFRYTDVRNHLYGPTSLSGTQTYKDKSIDFRVRLLKESAYLPQIAAGMRDVGGTGLFSSEYFVASKRTGDFDWSLGLAWGNMGARGDFGNPLSIFSNKFNTRPSGGNSAGEVNGKSLFRGRTALFGGVQYQTPWSPLILKLEYDGNDYKHEPFNTNLDAKSPINVGFVYRLNKSVDISAAFERGNRAMIGLTVHENFSALSATKTADPAPLPIVAARPQIKEADWSALTATLQTQSGWHVQSIRRSGARLDVVFDNPAAVYRKDRVERIATVLHKGAPADIDQFRIVQMVRGTPTASYVIRRDAWAIAHTQAVPPLRREPTVVPAAPPTAAAVAATPAELIQPMKRWDFSVGPGLSQSFGGPNGFWLYRVTANADASFQLTQSSWLAGGLSYRLLDNYNKFTYDAPSKLPRVRTYIRQYVTTSRLTIPYLQATHVGRLGNDQFYEVYGGLLEEMYAGVGGEWLYRPWHSPLAVGVDINRVRQRGFRQDFSLRDYQATTGHITAYWDTGWNGVHVNFSVGQYLAKDKGATLDVSRIFDNGVTIGAYATKTNVSAKQFGEGSFDKGIYLSIPFDALMARSSPKRANLVWAPLIRDGGAKLFRQFPLYDLTSERNPRSFSFGPPPTSP